MRKPAQERRFSHLWDPADKPNSVVDDHLSGTLVAQRLERHFPPVLVEQAGHGLARR